MCIILDKCIHTENYIIKISMDYEKKYLILITYILF